MNSVSREEVMAVEAASEVAGSGENLILVPLSQLLPRRSKRNARTTPRMSIPELAASIRRIGLLQNLVVVLAADGEHYEVVAGDRRLTALKLLAKRKRISPDHEVPCLLVPDEQAMTASLTENIMREQMHPADQFQAFAALAAEGRPVEDIAADFGVTPLVVQRRLRLANVSPRLIADYREERVTLDQLMALAITDDHDLQEAAFYGVPEWQREPGSLRARLTEQEVSAADPLVRFVGLEAYEAAGGLTRRDLFAEDDSGTYISQPELLDTLVRAKLAQVAEGVRAEGWSWVELVPRMSASDHHVLHRAPREHRTPTRREARRMKALEKRLDQIDVAFDEAEEAGEAETLEAEREQVAAELQTIEQGLERYGADIIAIGGVIVTVGSDAQATVLRGLLREAEAQQLRAATKARGKAARAAGGDAPEGDEDVHAKGVSDRLAQRLSAHRTAALQIEVARHPHAALAAVVHSMVRAVMQVDYDGEDLPVGVRLSRPDRLDLIAPGSEQSPAAVASRELRSACAETLPQDSTELFDVLLAKPQDELVQILAICAGASVDVLTQRAACHPRGAALAQAVGLDMANWWKPTADSYFGHVSKATILEGVGEFAAAEVTRLSKLKKAEIAQEAERLAAVAGWMPPIFRVDAAAGVSLSS